ncbi:MAG: hypothetical protein IKU09_04910 [Firmicutes bacterium]|nr:hypothetical protein [Bacillota bacterium]
MISNELKKLNRRELVDIIYQMKKNEQLLQDEVASLQSELQEKRIRLADVGSIADAAVSITDVFAAAQTAADLYLHEISCMKAETEKECSQMIEEARKAVDKIFADGRKQCEELSALYEMQAARCRQIQEELRQLEELKKLRLHEEPENEKQI